MGFSGEDRRGGVILGDYLKQFFEIPVAFFNAVTGVISDDFNTIILHMRQTGTTNLEPNRW